MCISVVGKAQMPGDVHPFHAKPQARVLENKAHAKITSLAKIPRKSSRPTCSTMAAKWSIAASHSDLYRISRTAFTSVPSFRAAASLRALPAPTQCEWISHPGDTNSTNTEEAPLVFRSRGLQAQACQTLEPPGSAGIGCGHVKRPAKTGRVE